MSNVWIAFVIMLVVIAAGAMYVLFVQGQEKIAAPDRTHYLEYLKAEGGSDYYLDTGTQQLYIIRGVRSHGVTGEYSVAQMTAQGCTLVVSDGVITDIRGC